MAHMAQTLRALRAAGQLEPGPGVGDCPHTHWHGPRGLCVRGTAGTPTAPHRSMALATAGAWRSPMPHAPAGVVLGLRLSWGALLTNSMPL